MGDIIQFVAPNDDDPDPNSAIVGALVDRLLGMTFRDAKGRQRRLATCPLTTATVCGVAFRRAQEAARVRRPNPRKGPLT
jgi:hypothetical protein